MTDHSEDHPSEFADVHPQPRQGKITLIEVVVAISIVVVLFTLFAPDRSSRVTSRRVQCINRLTNIALAIHNYANSHGVYPPAYTVDADGKPLHSWRTLVLPYLDQRALYDTIDFTKPWNDPANAKAYAAELSIFQCPSAGLDPHETTYLAVTTPNSFLRPTEARDLADLAADFQETLLVIDAPVKHAVHWMAPQDADESVVLGLANDGDLHHPGQFVAAFVDGRVRTLSPDMPEAEFRRLTTIAGDGSQDVEAPDQK